MTEKIKNMTALARTMDKSDVRAGIAERAVIREMVKSATDRGGPKTLSG